MSDRKAVIKNADMGEEMQQDAVDCATQALEKYNIEKVIKVFDTVRERKKVFLPDKSPSKPFSPSLSLPWSSIDPTDTEKKQ
jgi:hypothetical protein